MPRALCNLGENHAAYLCQRVQRVNGVDKHPQFGFYFERGEDEEEIPGGVKSAHRQHGETRVQVESRVHQIRFGMKRYTPHWQRQALDICVGRIERESAKRAQNHYAAGEQEEVVEDDNGSNYIDPSEEVFNYFGTLLAKRDVVERFEKKLD